MGRCAIPSYSDHLEAECLVPILVIVQGGAEEGAAAAVLRGGAPVESNGALGVQVVDFRTQPGERLRRVPFLDRRERTLAGLLGPLRELDTAAQHQDFARRENREERRAVRLLKEEIGAVVNRRVRADAEEPDLRRFAPAANHRQVSPAVEQPRRDELRLGAFVAQDRVAAAHVDVVVRAHVAGVADAEREPTAVVRAVQEGVPPQRPAFQNGVDPAKDPLDLARSVGLQVCRLRRLLLLDRRLPRRCWSGLRGIGARGLRRIGGRRLCGRGCR